MTCPECAGDNIGKVVVGLYSFYSCNKCNHCWDADWSDIDGSAKPAVIVSNSPIPPADVTVVSPSHVRGVTGQSPYPCPACGSTVGIVCSYQGRREEWECWKCGHGWNMPATEEQPV